MPKLRQLYSKKLGEELNKVTSVAAADTLLHALRPSFASNASALAAEWITRELSKFYPKIRSDGPKALKGTEASNGLIKRLRDVGGEKRAMQFDDNRGPRM